jgi:cysteine desulfurase
MLDARPEEVLFTSGATEANNLAILGLAGPTPGHLVTSAVEHPSVQGPIQQLVSRGFTHCQLAVTGAGAVAFEPSFIRPDTRLVAVMLANHETGALAPVAKLAQEIAGRVPFHCDAAAAAGKIAISFRELNVTSLTVSAHKFHGPKGIGALLVKEHAGLRPLLWGGHQQHGKRPGTEPVPLAVGMATALELAVRNMETNCRTILQLRELFLRLLRSLAAPVVLNGPDEGGVPHTVNLSFPGCAADVLLMSLDLDGIACSTGSACSSGSLLPSPVLRAMGVPKDVLHSALRFSLSSMLTPTVIEEAARRVARIVKNLRQQGRGG